MQEATAPVAEVEISSKSRLKKLKGSQSPHVKVIEYESVGSLPCFINRKKCGSQFKSISRRVSLIKCEYSVTRNLHDEIVLAHPAEQYR